MCQKLTSQEYTFGTFFFNECLLIFIAKDKTFLKYQENLI